MRVPIAEQFKGFPHISSMNYEEKLLLLWAVCFIVSGIIFALAFWFTPVS